MRDIDTTAKNVYNEDGKTFEELLKVAISNVNLHTLRKQIITSTTPEKESAENE